METMQNSLETALNRYEDEQFPALSGISAYL